MANKALPSLRSGGARRLLGFKGEPPTSLPVPKAQCVACEMKGRISIALEKKIKLNCPMTYAERFGQKAMMPSVVSSTWKNLLLASSMPLRLWRKITTVLVGIGQVLALGPTLCA